MQVAEKTISWVDFINAFATEVDYGGKEGTIHFDGGEYRYQLVLQLRDVPDGCALVQVLREVSYLMDGRLGARAVRTLAELDRYLARASKFFAIDPPPTVAHLVSGAVADFLRRFSDTVVELGSESLTPERAEAVIKLKKELKELTLSYLEALSN